MKAEYSIDEAIKFLGISKGTLYSRLKEFKHLNDYTKTTKGKRYITKEGLLKFKELNSDSDNSLKNPPDSSICLNDFYVEQIRAKDTQIEAKDIQIKALQDRINELTNELSKVNNLNHELYLSNKEINMTLIELNRNSQILMRQALPQPKVSIWSRIFKKDSSNEINS
jgi:hypothetical protein